MKNMKKLILGAILLFSLIFTSCSSNENVDIPNTTDNSNILIRKIIVTTGATIATEYFNYIDGNKLSTITGDEGLGKGMETFGTITYTGDLITKIEWPDDLTYVFVYTNNLLTQMKTYTNGGSKLLYVDNFVHNSNGTITDGNGTIFYFDSVGNFQKTVSSSGNTVTNFTYDTKNSPYKNIRGDKLALLHLVGYSYQNIVIKIISFDNPGSRILFERTGKYEYNSLGYPIFYKDVSTGTTITETYFY
jgi:hypothetical protein